jgi:phage antirepressor YoqD-like protein
MEIAELCGKQHKNVMVDIRSMFDQLGLHSADFTAEWKDSTGRTLPCYNLPKHETQVLVTGYSVVLRSKVLRRLEELEGAVKLNRMGLPNFDDPIESAEAWIASRKATKLLEAKNERLLDDNCWLHDENAELREKAKIADLLLEAQGYFSVGSVAKMIGYGPNKFFAMLREDGFLMKATARKNHPYQDAIDAGWFRMFPANHKVAIGVYLFVGTTYITTRGLGMLKAKYGIVTPAVAVEPEEETF